MGDESLGWIYSRSFLLVNTPTDCSKRDEYVEKNDPSRTGTGTCGEVDRIKSIELEILFLKFTPSGSDWSFRGREGTLGSE